MIYLEEHRDVGDGVDRAHRLATEHEEYAENAMVGQPSKHYLKLAFRPTFKQQEISILLEKS